MKKNKIDELKNLFESKKGYATTQELEGYKLHNRSINKLQKDGYIEKVKRGLYKWTGYEFEGRESWVDAYHIVPNGVICSFSAIAYYNLTTFIPKNIDIAVLRNSVRPTLPKYPPIKLYYFSQKQYELGISSLEVQGYKIKIYDIEKAVCDCVRLRNQIGIDIMIEVLKEYMKRKDRNIDRLMKYADILRIKKIISPYLEAMI